MRQLLNNKANKYNSYILSLPLRYVAVFLYGQTTNHKKKRTVRQLFQNPFIESFSLSAGFYSTNIKTSFIKNYFNWFNTAFNSSALLAFFWNNFLKYKRQLIL